MIAQLYAAPDWRKPTLSLGALDLDGGLRQSFSLGSLAGSPEFSFSIELTHGFRAGDVTTEYKIPQLETYVVPEGRDELLWLEPGGTTHIFKKEQIRNEVPADLKRMKVSWVPVVTSKGDYSFHSPDGWIYRYDAGSIFSIQAPSGRLLQFHTEGLRIKRIFQLAGCDEVTLLAVEENDEGLPQSLTVGSVRNTFRYDEKTEQLIGWHSSLMGYTKDQNQEKRNAEVLFSYNEQGQVQDITLPHDGQMHFEWLGEEEFRKQNPSTLQLPDRENAVYFAADDHYTYQYGLAKNGINLSRKDKLGIVDGFAFNPRTQQLIRKKRDGGETTEFYGVRGSSANRLESVRDEKGRESVKLVYDDLGRVTERHIPGMAPFFYSYDEHDRIVKIMRKEQIIATYEYEGTSERPIKITDALQQETHISYTPNGQLATYRNPAGAEYRYTYDPLGQLKEELLPLGYQKTIKRDSFGRVTHIREANGQERTFNYSADHQLDSVQDGDDRWSYSYNDDGTLRELMKNGSTWQKIEREKSPEGGGSIVRQTDHQGDETVMHFDEKGQLIRERNALQQEINYSRDPLGRLTGWSDQRGAAAELGLDAAGRTTATHTGEEDVLTGGANHAPSGESAQQKQSIEMAYDLTGRIRAKNNGEQHIRYSYNAAGQLTKIDYGSGQLIDYSYDEFGRVLTAKTAQGVVTAYTWDELDRKASEKNSLPDGSFTYMTWTYTATGAPERVAVYQNGTDDKNLLQDTVYHYDLLGRYQSISVNGKEEVTYHYDAQTMLISAKNFRNGWSISYEHHQPSQLPKSITTRNQEQKTISHVAYTWLDDGTLHSRHINGTTQRYEYDKLGRLTKVHSDD